MDPDTSELRVSRIFRILIRIDLHWLGSGSSSIEIRNGNYLHFLGFLCLSNNVLLYTTLHSQSLFNVDFSSLLKTEIFELLKTEMLKINLYIE